MLSFTLCQEPQSINDNVNIRVVQNVSRDYDRESYPGLKTRTDRDHIVIQYKPKT